MRAEEERIRIELTPGQEEILRDSGLVSDRVIDIPRREWARLADVLRDGKYDRPDPRWAQVEEKLRREAIYGDRWRARDQLRVIR